ncbi:hypothetical protein V8B97DRAFT_1919780 [Scleroderma yunnanense]
MEEEVGVDWFPAWVMRAQLRCMHRVSNCLSQVWEVVHSEIDGGGGGCSGCGSGGGVILGGGRGAKVLLLVLRACWVWVGGRGWAFEEVGVGGDGVAWQRGQHGIGKQSSMAEWGGTQLKLVSDTFKDFFLDFGAVVTSSASAMPWLCIFGRQADKVEWDLGVRDQGEFGLVLFALFGQCNFFLCLFLLLEEFLGSCWSRVAVGSSSGMPLLVRVQQAFACLSEEKSGWIELCEFG